MARNKKQRRNNQTEEDDAMVEAPAEPRVLPVEELKRLLIKRQEDSKGTAPGRFSEIGKILSGPDADAAIERLTFARLKKLGIVDENGDPIDRTPTKPVSGPKRTQLQPPDDSDDEDAVGNSGSDDNDDSGAESNAESRPGAEESDNESSGTPVTTPSRGGSKPPPRKSAVMPSIEEPGPEDDRPDGDGEVVLLRSPLHQKGLPDKFRTEAYHRKLWGGRFIVGYGERHAPLNLLQKHGVLTPETPRFGNGNTLGEKKKDGEWVYTADDIHGIYSVAFPSRINKSIADDLARLKPEVGKRVVLCYVRIGWREKDSMGNYIRDPNTNEHKIKKCWERKGVLRERWGEGTNEVIYDLAVMAVKRFADSQGMPAPSVSMSPEPLRGQSAAPNHGNYIARSSPDSYQDDEDTGLFVPESPAVSRRTAAQANSVDTQRMLNEMTSNPDFMAQVAAMLAARQAPKETPRMRAKRVAGLPLVAAY